MPRLEEGLARTHRRAVHLRDERAWKREVKTAFQEGSIKPNQLSIRALFEELVPNGASMVRQYAAGSGGGGYRESSSAQLFENNSAITTSGFSYITGHMVYTNVLEAWDDPEFVADQLVTILPSSMSSELLPGVSAVGDVTEPIPAGNRYPVANLTDLAVRTPQTEKRGIQIPITMEAVKFDRTGLVLTRASDVGKTLRINREIRILDCVCGVTNTFVYNDVPMNTYIASGGLYANLKASNALVDWTSIDAIEQLLAEITDPATGILLGGSIKQLLVPKKLEKLAMMIQTAVQVKQGADSGTVQTLTANPYAAKQFSIVSGPYVKQRTQSDTTWFAGDFKAAFSYVENEPLTVEDRPPGDSGWEHDVVAGWKAYEMGVPAALKPQKVGKSTAS